MLRLFAIACCAAFGIMAQAQADDLRILTTGAPKQVVQAVSDAFAARAGHRISIAQDTAGGVQKRVEAGEAADIIVATPAVLDGLIKSGKAEAGTRVDFASTGVGVGIREGLPTPDIATVDAIRALIAKTPSIALPDPKAGGTSALYLEGLFKKMGVAETVNAKARLKAGGYAAELVANGEADIVFHQISEIRPVKGVVLIGSLPAEIQSISVYSAALSKGAAGNAAARAMLAELSGPAGREAVQKAGMDAPK